MPLRRRALHLAALLSWLAAFAGGPTAAGATPSAAPTVGYVVNVLTDAPDADLGNPACVTATPGQCSLRAALMQSSATAGADTITFSVTGVITLTSATPAITNTLTLAGPGAALLRIDGDGNGPVLVIDAPAPASVYLEGLTLSGGDAGGVFVASTGPVVISATVLTGNSATFGGGLRASDPGSWVQLINSSVVTNTAARSGGGVNASGRLEISNSRIEGNAVASSSIAAAAEPQGFSLDYAGGGIYANGPLTMTDSLVLGNTATTPTPLQASGPAGVGGGPYGAGVALVNTVAVIRGSTLAGNYFGVPALSAGAAAPAGAVQGLGGGLYNSNTALTVIDSQILDNAAYWGGGLNSNNGDVLLLRTQVVDNTAQGAGGGVYADEGPLVIRDSTFTDNNANNGPAGGLFFAIGVLVIRDSAFDQNEATLGGGGLDIVDALVTIERTQVHHNTAGYAPFAVGQTLVPQGGSGDGGGLLLVQSIAVIRQSVIYSNTANGGGGGGVSNSGTLTMTNVTVSGNTATGNGGGVALTQPPVSVASVTGGPAIRAYLRHVTLASNTADFDNNSTGNGGGVFAGANLTMTFSSSLVALNVDLSGPAPACGGPGGFVSAGYNLWTETTNCSLVATAGDQFNVASGLQPLQNNGGGTLTHGLFFGSLALDTADPAQCLPTDQRGVARPFGAGCDIGAFELAGLYLPLLLR